MKTLIIYESIHHGNTEKIATIINQVLNGCLIKVSDANIDMLDEYDLVGFGSGIYYGNLHKNIIRFIDSFKILSPKKAFVFSTSGQGKIKYNKKVEQMLNQKNFQVVGSFTCKGYDTFGPFKLVGGISKGKPDDNDLKKAKEFAQNLIKL